MSELFPNLRVIEISIGGAVPWLCKHLAWHGAEVIRIEWKSHPDAIRQYVSPAHPEKGVQANTCPWLTEWHSGKTHAGLNLETEDGQRLLDQLVATSDVVAVNLGAGVMERLKLVYDRFRAANGSVIVYHNTGYGFHGPYRNFLAWGPQIEPLSGISYLTRYPDGKPAGSAYALPDWMCSLYGMFAVMAALDFRQKTGRGQYIDLSMFESAVAAIGDPLLDYMTHGRDPGGQGNSVPYAAPHGCYPCKGEDRWCVINTFTQEEWASLCRVLEHPEWMEDARFKTLEARLANEAALDELIGLWTTQRSAEEVMQELQAADVPAGVVETVEDLWYNDPQLKARRFFPEFNHQFLNQKVVGTGLAIRLCEPEERALRAGMTVGQDNRYVFEDLLGLSQAQVEQFIRAGAIDAG